jgi:hypothetical protein
MKAILKILSVLIFAIGILIGMALTAGTVVASLESDFYFGPGYPSDEGLKTLKCPVVMTSQEVGVISVSLVNTTDKTIEPMIQLEISNPGLFENPREKYPIEVGASRRIQWEVTSENAVFDRLILIRAYQFPTYRTPSRSGTCGILMVDLFGLRGNQILTLVFTTSLVCIGLGLGMWLLLNRPLRGKPWMASRAMLAVASSVAVGMVVGYYSIWLLGIIALVLALLMSAEVIKQFVLAE